MAGSVAGGGGDRSKAISDLVLQLKNGDISKSELYASLSKLHHKATTSGVGGGGGANGALSPSKLGKRRQKSNKGKELHLEPQLDSPLASHATDFASDFASPARSPLAATRNVPYMSSWTESGGERAGGGVDLGATTSTLTQEDRRKIIQRLIEEKRLRVRARSASSVGVGTDADDFHFEGEGSGGEPSPWYPSGDVEGSSAGGYPFSNPSPHTRGGDEDRAADGNDICDDGYELSRGAWSDGQQSFGYDAYEFRRKQQQQQQRHGFVDRPTTASARSRRGVDQSAYEFRSYREERARQVEEVMRQELMSECTFRPRIKPLPAAYGKAARNVEAAPFVQRAEKWQREKERDVTSRKAEEEYRELDECTFAPIINPNSKRAAVMRLEETGQLELEPHERLYAEAERKAMDREMMAAARREQEEAELAAECTFAPQLQASSRGRARSLTGERRRVRSQSWCAESEGRAPVTTGQRWRQQTRVLPTGMEECTFSPVVLGAKDDMCLVKEYLGYNVFDRLAGSSIANLESPRSLRGVKQAGTDLDNSPSSARKTASTEDSFREFMNRQNEMEYKKAHKAQMMAEEIMRSTTFRPRICTQSKRIHDMNNTGSFLERVARDQLKKEHEAMRKQTSADADSQCTFAPQTTARSKRKPARSATEMSRGDQLKRETLLRLSKLRAEQERLADVTFMPELNATDHVQGRLQLSEAPDTYVQRMKMSEHAKDVARRKLEQDRAVKEVEGCTFQPETTACPSYIKRIAQSLAAAKASERIEAPGKPDWR